jgi:hypothetical protein
MRALLDRASSLYSRVSSAIKKGVTGLSSGAIAHLVKIDDATGRVLRWPIAEGSITPEPANAHARISHHTVRQAALRSHFERAGLAFDEHRLSPTDYRWPPPELVRQSQRRRLAQLNRQVRALEISELSRFAVASLSEVERDLMRLEAAVRRRREQGAAP